MVTASSANVELGALFMNMKERHIIRLTLAEMGHPHLPTPIQVVSTTAFGIVNNANK